MALTIPNARIAGMDCKITDLDYNLFWDDADNEEGKVKLTLRLTAQSENPIALAIAIERAFIGAVEAMRETPPDAPQGPPAPF